MSGASATSDRRGRIADLGNVHRTGRPDGGAYIVLVAERPLWLWWDADAKWATERPFTVVNLTVDKSGQGH